MTTGLVTSAKAKAGVTLCALAALGLVVPSAGFALPTLISDGDSPGYGLFTPASVDPQLARRVNARIRSLGVAARFTPAGAEAPGKRTVTVAVRVDEDTARAISVRQSAKAAIAQPGIGQNRLTKSQYNLGIARGYQTFAKPPSLPDTVKSISMPDLAEFEPAKGTVEEKQSRFQPRIALEHNVRSGVRSGRSPRALKSGGEQTFDVGGAYRITRNLDVTAGVRLTQDRDRLAPLTDDVQDSQAVYVGTQFRF